LKLNHFTLFAPVTFISDTPVFGDNLSTTFFDYCQMEGMWRSLMERQTISRICLRLNVLVKRWVYV